LSRFRAAADRTFHSLRVRNYRLYFFGQTVSLTGTWMQSVAQAWLVLKLTGSGFAVGLVTGLQFLPILLLGSWGGLIADRMDKRRVLLVTQTLAASLALALGLVVLFDVVRLWMVFGLAGALGLVTVVDMPTRQSFVMEMVGPEDLTNAVSLNSVIVNASRVVGPALAGLLIASVGTGICFLINAASYPAVLVGLALMRKEDLRRRAPVMRSKGQVREGFRYVLARPGLRTPLLLMAVAGTLAYNFSILLPLMTQFVFHAGAGAYGLLFSLMGTGAVLGGLFVAGRQASRRILVASVLAFGVLVVLAGVASTLALEMAVMLPLGAASTGFIANSNALLQLGSSPEMRGRVMALFSVVFLGSTPLGGPLVGWIAERFGPRTSLVVAGAATVIAGALVASGSSRRSRGTVIDVPRDRRPTDEGEVGRQAAS
jgi:MFS family permease